MDSSDLELHTDSSSSGGSPRGSSPSPSSDRGFPTNGGGMSPRETAALLTLIDQQHDPDQGVTTSHVTIKPNLKLMSNSERGKYYRRKRKLYAAELSASVSKLRRQVETLATTQQLRLALAVSHKQTPLGSFAKLVREYCAQFEFGAPVQMALTAPNGGGPGELQLVRVSTASSQQRSFLCAAMEEQVGFGEFCGIELLLDQWQRYSMYHAALRFELKSLDVVSPSLRNAYDADAYDAEEEPASPVIVVRADLHVRYSLETIKQVFPHLMDDVALVQELIGLEVSYPCVNHFYFSSSGKIQRYNPEVDFMAALAAKIHSTVGAAHVLNRALIAKDHMIGVLEDEMDKSLNISQDNPEIITEAPAISSRYDTSSSSSTSSSSFSDERDVREKIEKPTSRLDLEFILS